MALLRRIMHPKLNSAGSDAEYINKLSESQQVVREYERISGSELDQNAADAGTSSVTLGRNWHRLQESDTGDRGLLALEENL